MEPLSASSADDEGEQQHSSRFFLHSFFIFFFTSCHYSGSNANLSVKLVPVVYKEEAVEQKKTVLPVKKKKTIYITFDDGPNKGTKQVLQIVNEEQLPVTFFVIGEHVSASRAQQQAWDSLKQSQWVELCNHSFTHANHNHFAPFYENDSAVVADFERCSDSLKLLTKIARTPGRNIWRTPTVTATDIAQSKPAGDSLYNAGFTVIGWDLEWHYNDSLKLKQTSNELIRQVDSVFNGKKTKTPDHMVLLTHDQIFYDSTDAGELRKFMKYIKTTSDYNVKFISKYPGVKQ